MASVQAIYELLVAFILTCSMFVTCERRTPPSFKPTATTTTSADSPNPSNNREVPRSRLEIDRTQGSPRSGQTVVTQDTFDTHKSGLSVAKDETGVTFGTETTSLKTRSVTQTDTTEVMQTPFPTNRKPSNCASTHRVMRLQQCCNASMGNSSYMSFISGLTSVPVSPPTGSCGSPLNAGFGNADGALNDQLTHVMQMRCTVMSRVSNCVSETMRQLFVQWTIEESRFDQQPPAPQQVIGERQQQLNGERIANAQRSRQPLRRTPHDPFYQWVLRPQYDPNYQPLHTAAARISRTNGRLLEEGSF